MRALLVVIGYVLLSATAQAQLPFLYLPERVETREGNKQYKEGKFSDAEAGYKKALDKKNNMPEAQFNLGNAIYEQKRYDTAMAQFRIAAQTNPDTSVKVKALHNLGNCYMQQEKWKEAIDCYKQSLKLLPGDTNTKYNLAYANEKLREQQKQQQNQQNKQDQQPQKQQEQKQNEPKPQDQKEQQQKQQPQPKLSKEEAEKLLQALQNEEQKTNQKMQQKQMKAVRVKVEKDW